MLYAATLYATWLRSLILTRPMHLASCYYLFLFWPKSFLELQVTHKQMQLLLPCWMTESHCFETPRSCSQPMACTSHCLSECMLCHNYAWTQLASSSENTHYTLTMLVHTCAQHATRHVAQACFLSASTCFTHDCQTVNYSYAYAAWFLRSGMGQQHSRSSRLIASSSS